MNEAYFQNPVTSRDGHASPRRLSGRTTHDVSHRYRTLLIDPPWPARGNDPLPVSSTRPSLNLHQLKALPVTSLAHTDAHLWMWCTNATLRDAYELLETWEFTPRAPITWIKPCPGLDPHLRSRTEHLILGTRGDAQVDNHGQPTWMFTPTQDHRERTDKEYSIIESVSPGPYLALFATICRPGWDTWDAQKTAATNKAN